MDIRNLLRRQLTLLGYECVTASRADEALERLRVDAFDAVLSDIGLPEMDGLALLQEIRRIEPGQMVVMVTASRSITHAVDALQHGAVDYIVKPFDVATISTVVARVIERKKSRARIQRQWQSLEDSVAALKTQAATLSPVPAGGSRPGQAADATADAPPGPVGPAGR